MNIESFTPLPPTNLIMSNLWQMVFLIGTSIVLVVTSIFAIRILIQKRDFVPLLSVFGGILTAGTIEFFIGPAGLLFYPTEGQIPFLQAAGRVLPLFVATGNGFWYGPALILFGNIVFKAKSKKKIWLLFGAVFLVDLIMEAVGTSAGVFVYYGNQGIRILGFPLWWLIQNAALTVVIGWIISHLRKSYLKGWRVILIIPMIPCLAMAANGFNGLFGWLGIHTTSWMVYAGTLASMAMSLISIDLIAHVHMKNISKSEEPAK